MAKIKGDAQIDRQRGCGEKNRFSHPIAATKAAYDREAVRKMPYEVYRCRYCHYYHIGRAKDRSMFDYGYDGAVVFKHPADVWRSA